MPIPRKISRSEVKSFIKHLCNKFGIPLPIIENLNEASYNEGEYENLTIYIKRETHPSVALHEFLHYIIHLIKDLDGDEEDNLEHRFINWIETHMLASVWDEYEKHKKKGHS